MMDYSIINVKGIKFKIRKNNKADKQEIKSTCISKDYNPRGFGIRGNDTVIDIGAYIGSFTVYAARIARKGMIYAYEPYPESFIMLRENIRINKLANVKTFNLGVLGRNRKTRLHKNPFLESGHSIYIETEDFVKIRCISLKEIFNKNRINFCDFLKMDCEGAEYDILFNTPEEIFRKIGKIALEYHDYLYRGTGVYKLVSFLSKRGFRKMGFKPFKPLKLGRGILYAKRKA